jgi:hypothetical protein
MKTEEERLHVEFSSDVVRVGIALAVLALLAYFGG